MGVATNVKGGFKLDKIKAGDYCLVITTIGYLKNVIELQGLSNAIDFGELVLYEDNELLDEVTVTASNIVNQPDRKVVFPSQKQLEVSTNGVNLLQAMMLPRLQINSVSNTIGISGGGEVQVRMNGVKVDIHDIIGLQPADIIRIEYIENPGLRYGTAEAVLNYITRRHESGGSVSVDMMNSPHVVFHNDEISARFNHKKSEFSMYYATAPRDFYQYWRTNEERFHFADGTSLNRYEKGKPGRLTEMNHGAALTYNYQEPDRYSLNVKAGYWGYLQPHTDFNSELYNLQYPDQVVEIKDYTGQTTHRPSLDLYYQHNLKNKQFLALNLVGTYIYSDLKRSYQETQNEIQLTDIFSGVTGNKYSVIGEGIYEKGFEKGRLSAGLKHTLGFSENKYTGTRAYNTEMKQSDTYLYTEYQGKWKKLNYTLGAGVTRSYLKQRGEASYQTYTFRPRISLRYGFSDNLYARLNGNLVNNPPALSQLSAVEQLIDSMQIQRGNPVLSPYNRYQTDLYIEYQKNKFSAAISSRYQNNPKAIMESTFVENGMFVHTYNNQNSFQYFNSELTLRAGMLWNILQLSLSGGVNRFWSDGKDYQHTYTNWYYRAEVMGQYKRFMALFSIYNRRNEFWGETMTSGENLHILMLMYNYKQISIGGGFVNPFSDNYKRITENWNQHASTHKEMFCNESSRVFFFKLAWNFNSGRNYKNTEKKINNQDRESGVMSVGK